MINKGESCSLGVRMHNFAQWVMGWNSHKSQWWWRQEGHPVSICSWAPTKSPCWPGSKLPDPHTRSGGVGDAIHIKDDLIWSSPVMLISFLQRLNEFRHNFRENPSIAAYYANGTGYYQLNNFEDIFKSGGKSPHFLVDPTSPCLFLDLSDSSWQTMTSPLFGIIFELIWFKILFYSYNSINTIGLFYLRETETLLLNKTRRRNKVQQTVRVRI